MYNRNYSLQDSNSPYLRQVASSEEHSNAVAEMATFEQMANAFGQEFSPFAPDDEDEEEDD